MKGLRFQSPISGVNDWNKIKIKGGIKNEYRFSLLSAELMIGTSLVRFFSLRRDMFQSPISGVNDWNYESNSNSLRRYD